MNIKLQLEHPISKAHAIAEKDFNLTVKGLWTSPTSEVWFSFKYSFAGQCRKTHHYTKKAAF